MEDVETFEAGDTVATGSLLIGTIVDVLDEDTVRVAFDGEHGVVVFDLPVDALWHVEFVEDNLKD